MLLQLRQPFSESSAGPRQSHFFVPSRVRIFLQVNWHSVMGKDNSSASEPIPPPEDNVKPLDYKEQFSVRSIFLHTGA